MQNETSSFNGAGEEAETRRFFDGTQETLLYYIQFILLILSKKIFDGITGSTRY